MSDRPCPECEQPFSEPAGPRCAALHTPPEELNLRGLFHRLWTKAVDQPGYVKGEWKILREKLNAIGLDL